MQARERVSYALLMMLAVLLFTATAQQWSMQWIVLPDGQAVEQAQALLAERVAEGVPCPPVEGPLTFESAHRVDAEGMEWVVGTFTAPDGRYRYMVALTQSRLVEGHLYGARNEVVYEAGSLAADAPVFTTVESLLYRYRCAVYEDRVSLRFIGFSAPMNNAWRGALILCAWIAGLILRKRQQDKA